jgi:hypothetical protein
VDLSPPKRRRGNGRLIAALAGILLLVGLVAAPGILNAREQQLEAQRAAATQTALASGTSSAGTTPSVTTTQTTTGSPTVSPTATPNFAIPTATAPAQVDTDMGSPPPTPLGTGPQKLADPSPMCDSPPGPPWVLADQSGITCVASSDGGVTVAAKAAPRLGCIEQQSAAQANGYVDALAAPGTGTVVLGFRLAASGGRAGYYFSINPASDSYDLYRLDKDGNKTGIKSDTLPKALAAHFDLGASFNGGSIALYVNGNRIAQATDTAYSSGAMGLCSDGSATFRDARIFAAAG